MPYSDKSIHIHRLFFFIVVCERFHICDFFFQKCYFCVYTHGTDCLYTYIIKFFLFQIDVVFFISLSLPLFNGFPFQNREISRCLHVDCVWQKFLKLGNFHYIFFCYFSGGLSSIAWDKRTLFFWVVFITKNNTNSIVIVLLAHLLMHDLMAYSSLFDLFNSPEKK